MAIPWSCHQLAAVPRKVRRHCLVEKAETPETQRLAFQLLLAVRQRLLELPAEVQVVLEVVSLRRVLELPAEVRVVLEVGSRPLQVLQKLAREGLRVAFQFQLLDCRRWSRP